MMILQILQLSQKFQGKKKKNQRTQKLHYTALETTTQDNLCYYVIKTIGTHFSMARNICGVRQLDEWIERQKDRQVDTFNIQE